MAVNNSSKPENKDPKDCKDCKDNKDSSFDVLGDVANFRCEGILSDYDPFP